MTSPATRHDGPADGFCHEALFYAGTEDFVARTVPFVRDGLAGQEAVLVAVPRLASGPSRKGSVTTVKG